MTTVCPACSKAFPKKGMGGHMRYCTATPLDFFWTKVDKNGSGGCWLWKSYRNERGYGLMTLPGGGKNIRAHRWLYEQLHGPLKPGEWLLHKCDVRHCVNPDHMFIGDHEANMADKKAKKRSAWGDMGRHKLTRAQAEEVLREYWYDPAHRESNARELASRYGVLPGAITSIIAGRSWPYLDRSILRSASTRSKA